MGENRLANETSSYLRGAARQPVDWYPFGDDAFRKARELDRPILLDIGASWCHWCHVIDRESYEDPDLAKIINENFVAVKVDRDERPDVDARYQQAVGTLTNHGGWPLTAFLTPDGKVFYGGTYFPPKDTHGQPSFRRVLQAVADHYKTSKAEAIRDAEALHQSLAEERGVLAAQGSMNEASLRAAFDALRGAFDPVNGGFGTAPKFPHPGTVDFLMARYHRVREDGYRNVFVRTLRGMARGGVYDQIGGGFHRYSVDAQWIVPHFEKMLYDNAGLLTNYVHAWQLTREPLFRETAEGIVAWADEVLSDRERGGYYASQDADVGLEDDGDYFTWTLEELRAAVSADEARVLAAHFDVDEPGEMRHDRRRNVLFVEKEPEALAKELGMPAERVGSLLESGRRAMKVARDRRPSPAIDRTIFASWNGMMVASCLRAGLAFARADVTAFALKTLGRILDDLWTKEHGMWHGIVDGTRKVRGLLEDHVYVVEALLSAYTATADASYLRRAEEIMQFTIRHFWDPRGGFLDVADDLHEGAGLSLLEIRRRPIEDSPYAGANAVAALSLQRLHSLTGNDEYRLKHDALMMAFAGEAGRYGAIYCGTYFLAAELWVHKPAEVVILGPRDDPRMKGLHAAASSSYAPSRSVLVAQGKESYLPAAVAPMLRTREAMAGPVAFVCKGTTCSPPTADPEKVRALLEAAG
ncbi:MAG: thioredoxin domain-containing protein [Methanobacteriota archaeon]